MQNGFKKQLIVVCYPLSYADCVEANSVAQRMFNLGYKYSFTFN